MHLIVNGRAVNGLGIEISRWTIHVADHSFHRLKVYRGTYYSWCNGKWFWCHKSSASGEQRLPGNRQRGLVYSNSCMRSQGFPDATSPWCKAEKNWYSQILIWFGSLVTEELDNLYDVHSLNNCRHGPILQKWESWRSPKWDGMMRSTKMPEWRSGRKCNICSLIFSWC